MIHIPLVRRRHNNHWKVIAIGLMVIIFLAVSFLSLYFYVFGAKNPLKAASVTRPTNIYVAPQYRLSSLIKDRIIK
ncbi:MAG: hypothetical protein WCG01_05330 [bacterium]